MQLIHAYFVRFELPTECWRQSASSCSDKHSLIKARPLPCAVVNYIDEERLEKGREEGECEGRGRKWANEWEVREWGVRDETGSGWRSDGWGRKWVRDEGGRDWWSERWGVRDERVRGEWGSRWGVSCEGRKWRVSKKWVRDETRNNYQTILRVILTCGRACTTLTQLSSSFMLLSPSVR